MWKYNTKAAGYVAGDIVSGTYGQCGAGVGGIAGSALSMALDPDNAAPTVDNVVLKAVGGTANTVVNGKDDGKYYECILSHTSSATDRPGVTVPTANWATYWRVKTSGSGAIPWVTSTPYVSGICSVQFLGGIPKAGAGEGNISGTMLVKGTGWEGSRIGLYGDGGTENSLHGLKSATRYEIIAGASGVSVTGTARPYSEIIVSAGETIYIAGVTMSRGKNTSLIQAYIPPRHEAHSTTGPPTTGYWRSGAIIWNTSTESYWETGRSITGTPIAWLCTSTGTAGGSAAFKALGQISMRVGTAELGSAYTSNQVGEILRTTGTSQRVWMATDDNTTDWVELTNTQSMDLDGLDARTIIMGRSDSLSGKDNHPGWRSTGR